MLGPARAAGPVPRQRAASPCAASGRRRYRKHRRPRLASVARTPHESGKGRFKTYATASTRSAPHYLERCGGTDSMTAAARRGAITAALALALGFGATGCGASASRTGSDPPRPRSSEHRAAARPPTGARTGGGRAGGGGVAAPDEPVSRRRRQRPRSAAGLGQARAPAAQPVRRRGQRRQAQPVVIGAGPGFLADPGTQQAQGRPSTDHRRAERAGPVPRRHYLRHQRLPHARAQRRRRRLRQRPTHARRSRGHRRQQPAALERRSDHRGRSWPASTCTARSTRPTIRTTPRSTTSS